MMLTIDYMTFSIDKIVTLFQSKVLLRSNFVSSHIHLFLVSLHLYHLINLQMASDPSRYLLLFLLASYTAHIHIQ